MKHNLLKLSAISDIITSEIKDIILKNRANVKIANVIVGEDISSLSYIRGMQKKAANVGITLEIVNLDKNIGEKDFFRRLEELNDSCEISGIIVQTPLPKHIDFSKISASIDYKKDLDGITCTNQGLLFSGKPFLIPATAWACDLTLQYIEKNYSFPLRGKNAVVIGRSLTVGKPVFHLLLARDITPSIIHTKTIEKEKITQNADIIIATCGIPELVTASWLKEDCVVVDVGIHCIECNVNKTFKLCGDVNAASCLHKAAVVTAVPGGIGVVTSSLLFANAVKSYLKISSNEEIEFEFLKKI